MSGSSGGLRRSKLSRFALAFSLRVDEAALAEGVRIYQYKSPNMSLFERLWLNALWEKMPLWCLPCMHDDDTY